MAISYYDEAVNIVYIDDIARWQLLPFLCITFNNRDAM